MHYSVPGTRFRRGLRWAWGRDVMGHRTPGWRGLRLSGLWRFASAPERGRGARLSSSREPVNAPTHLGTKRAF